jgi:hypothetical protein
VLPTSWAGVAYEFWPPSSPSSRHYEAVSRAVADAKCYSSLLSTLSGLMTALTTLLWLLSSFQLVTAFLHSVLFFGVSIPLNHLVVASQPTSARADPVDDVGEETLEKKSKYQEEGLDPVQLEVDLRARCERPPYESYHWVWWAWWAQRRGPLGEAFAAVTAITGLCTVSPARRTRMMPTRNEES